MGRARAIRAVVAAQWGVAIGLAMLDEEFGALAQVWYCAGPMVAALPTAEQIVYERLG